MRSYHVRFTKRAAKELSKLPRTAQERIAAAVDWLKEEPRPAGVTGVTKLSGDAELYRIRVGDYRVLYGIEDDVLLVLVVRVGHRRDVYR